mgnify:CR=1 FL=1
MDFVNSLFLFTVKMGIMVKSFVCNGIDSTGIIVIMEVIV